MFSNINKFESARYHTDVANAVVWAKSAEEPKVDVANSCTLNGDGHSALPTNHILLKVLGGIKSLVRPPGSTCLQKYTTRQHV